MKASTAIILVGTTAISAVAGWLAFGARQDKAGNRSCAVQDGLFKTVMAKARAGGLPETLAGLIEDDWQRLDCAQRAVKLIDLAANGVK